MENIRVISHSGQIAVHWKTDEARFHVFIDDDQPRSMIYKNSLVARGRDYPAPAGYFDTRKLDATKKANAWIIEEVMRVVREGDLINKAKAEYDAKQAAEQRAIEDLADQHKRACDVFKHIAEMLERNGDQTEIKFNHTQLKLLMLYAPDSTA